MKLTKLEKQLLNAMRDNEFNDALECGTWVFAAIDDSGVDAKQARGIISSLIQKGLVVVDVNGGYNSVDNPSMIGFTEEGKRLFDNADGNKCSWGGANLLKIEEDEKENRTMIKVVERKTGEEFVGVRTLLSNGKDGWAVEDLEGNVIKTLSESTFKKYYKVTGETVAAQPEQDTEVQEEVKEEPKAKKAAKAAKETECELYTFTNMKIQGSYKATLVGKEYHINTQKKGLLIFDAKTLKQLNCKNPKFANHIVLA